MMKRRVCCAFCSSVCTSEEPAAAIGEAGGVRFGGPIALGGRQQQPQRKLEAGIGVRIEDDILVTVDGNENLSAGLPRRADDIEAWMRSLRS